MILHVTEAARLFPSTEQAPVVSPFTVEPKLEAPTQCLGFAMVELANKIDFNNANYIKIAVNVCNALMENLSSFSNEHLKKLESRASLLASSRVWSAVLSICSLVGSAFALFAGMSSPSPTASLIGIALGLLPFIYNALSTGVEQKDLSKAGRYLGPLLATALFFSYFQVQISPTDIVEFLKSGVKITEVISGVAGGIYEARLTWKEGELEALQFLTEAMQQKLQEMTGSMADNIKSVATNVSFLNDVMSQYIATKTNFITR